MITPCRDMSIIEEFMMLPEVRRYAEEYGSATPKFEASKKELWFTFRKSGEAAGMINMHVETGSMCQFHPYILRKHRMNYVEMVREFFGWFIKTMPPEAIKLNAIIPSCYKATIDAGIEAGGTVEGVDRMSYRKDESKVYDRILLGITRQEMSNG